MTIKLTLLDVDGATDEGPGVADSVMLSFDRPGRAEIVVREGKLLIHIYHGNIIDPHQVPMISYEPDGSDLSVGESVIG